jgi:hypothetical protein
MFPISNWPTATAPRLRWLVCMPTRNVARLDPMRDLCPWSTLSNFANIKKTSGCVGMMFWLSVLVLRSVWKVERFINKKLKEILALKKLKATWELHILSQNIGTQPPAYLFRIALRFCLQYGQ